MTNSLTTPAAEEYLASTSNLILATLRKDAGPQLSPVWFVWRDGTFFISTTPTTAKWLNLQRDQRCSGIIDNPDGRYIYIAGVAELSIEDDPLDITTEIVHKYKTDDEFEPYMKIVHGRGDSRGIIRLKPTSTITRELD
jgi:PPOX class probable F420-dependent enzyme